MAARHVPHTRPRQIARWLMLVAALVIAMVVVGGITRLTESGLSITQWKPVTGFLPPLNEAQWEAEFARYRQIPEYREITGPAGMTLSGYKAIYFWEWVHRLLGRVIGLAFALPLAWFWWRGAIPAGYKARLVALLALGGAQGVFGWLMVRSGLSDRTDVSHFWLSIHLLTALLTLALLVWTACDMLRLTRNDSARPARLAARAAVPLAVLAVQLMLGAWVAGLDAGHIASDWPTMQGRLVPDGVDWSRGLGFALTHDPYLIHFLHRWWALVVLAALVLLARRARRAGAMGAALAVDVALAAQIVLGIATVLSGMAIVLATLHQFVGALLVAAATWAAHGIGSPRD